MLIRDWPTWGLWLIFVLVWVFSFGISYMMALAGRPDAVWLWRDVLGVISG